MESIKNKVNPEDLKQEWTEDGNKRFFKVILPSSEEEQKEGIGELVWCTAKEGTIAELDDNSEERAIVELAVDSLYYPKLKKHNLIVAKMRGEFMPIAEFDKIDKYFGPSQRDFILEKYKHPIIFSDEDVIN